MYKLRHTNLCILSIYKYRILRYNNYDERSWQVMLEIILSVIEIILNLVVIILILKDRKRK